MARVPNLDADVHFGNPTKPLPNWRANLPEEESDDDDVTEEDRAGLTGMLGFDPAELFGGDDDGNNEE